MAHLLLDVNSIVPFYTVGSAPGVGRSTMELLKALSEIPSLPFKLTLFSRNLKGIGAKNLPDGPYRKLHLPIPNRPLYKKVEDSLHIKKLLTNYDFLHIPHNTDSCEDLSKTIFTIHDLIVYRYPEMWGLTNEDRAEFERIAKGCRAIVTCSESSKQDIVKFWKVPDEKVTVIPWGLNREIFSPSEESVEIKGLGSEFFFSASCNHPRKNTPLVAEAFAEYVKMGGNAQLVLLNPKADDLKGFETLVDSKKILIISNASDRELVWLYTNAKASIVASLYEGFGLPVLESLGCHTQVICARNSSLVEAGGEVVDYLPELTAQALTAKLLQYDSCPKSATIDIPATERHLSNFTWSGCAHRYIAFWERLLAR